MAKKEKKQMIDIDYWRQLDVFAPDSFKTPITIIGAGATGSYVTWLLAKMGCRDIKVYDFDKVEDYNVPNQMFGPGAIGLNKVDALQKAVYEGTGITITPINRRFTIEAAQGIVYNLVDTMKDRKEIWDNSIKYQPMVELLLETRMESKGGRLYAIKPCYPNHVAAYEKTLYTDEEAEESPCSNRSISPTVATLAGFAVFAMLNHVNNEAFPNETILSLSPFVLLTKNY